MTLQRELSSANERETRTTLVLVERVERIQATRRYTLPQWDQGGVQADVSPVSNESSKIFTNRHRPVTWVDAPGQ